MPDAQDIVGPRSLRAADMRRFGARLMIECHCVSAVGVRWNLDRLNQVKLPLDGNTRQVGMWSHGWGVGLEAAAC
jgi:hypothetical protein